MVQFRPRDAILLNHDRGRVSLAFVKQPSPRPPPAFLGELQDDAPIRVERLVSLRRWLREPRELSDNPLKGAAWRDVLLIGGM